MRISCHSIDDFLINLASAPEVLECVVYVDKSARYVDGDKRDAARREIVLQASTVVVLPGDGGQYLLCSGESCGIDYLDASQEFGGSERADDQLGKLKRFCEEHGLVVRPGLIGI